MQCSPYLKSALVLRRIRHTAKQSDADSAFTEDDWGRMLGPAEAHRGKTLP